MTSDGVSFGTFISGDRVLEIDEITLEAGSVVLYAPILGPSPAGTYRGATIVGADGVEVCSLPDQEMESCEVPAGETMWLRYVLIPTSFESY